MPEGAGASKSICPVADLMSEGKPIRRRRNYSENVRERAPRPAFVGLRHGKQDGATRRSRRSARRRFLTNDFSKRSVHCLRVREHLGNVRLQNDHVRSLCIPTYVFSAYPLREIVFVLNRLSAQFARCLSHKTCVLGGWLLEGFGIERRSYWKLSTMRSRLCGTPFNVSSRHGCRYRSASASNSAMCLAASSPDRQFDAATCG
jgi:hypothetical protein